ncbi:MAG TPA: hypothetical protein VN019_10745 [Oxalicibacterium sp.]|nr:hypothetical protein [Oxalicibacterium sp.]
MSRRFGRNQRRRAREQIAEAERVKANLIQCLDGARAVLHEKSDKLADLQEFFKQVACQVGEHAIISGLEVGYMRNGQMMDGHRMPVCSPSPLDLPSNIESETITIQDEIMRLLEIDVVRDHFNRQMNVRAHLADGKVGYLISESAIMMMRPNELHQRLVPQVARELSVALTAVLRRGGR